MKRKIYLLAIVCLATCLMGGAAFAAGTSPSTLDPAGSMTRAQLATVLMNLSTK